MMDVPLGAKLKGDTNGFTNLSNEKEQNRVSQDSQGCPQLSNFWPTFAFQHGITIRGVGNRVSHNLIHDGPDIGIRLYGNDHVIEYNEIYNVCQQLADTGAIYIGRDFTYRGNIIRYNKIHDIYGYGLNTTGSKLDSRYQYETPYQAWGIYLDDCTCGTTVFGNIIYRVPLCGVMVGGGRDNIIKNNIFVDCIPAIFIGARSLNLFKRSKPILNKRLQKMNYMDPPYSIRYPNLASLVEDDRRKPTNNHFIRNIVTYSSDNLSGLSSMVPRKNAAIVYYLNEFDQKTTLFQNNFIWHNNLPVRISFRSYDGKKKRILNWQAWQHLGFDNESKIEDPLFVDNAGHNYQLREESPVNKLGFKPIPIEKIGLYKSKLRASWPVESCVVSKDNWRKVHTIEIQ